MKRTLLALAVICTVITLAACPKFVQASVDTLAASQGFIAQAQANHSSLCTAEPSRPFPCQTINEAVAAQNVGVSALEAYCQLPVAPDPATLAALGTKTCNADPTKKQVLVAALANISKIIAGYKAVNGGKP